MLAQNVTIRGKAHASYAGKIIKLYAARDYITNMKNLEAIDTIASDGFFELNWHSPVTRPVSLKIGNVVANLFVQPDFVYGITIPEVEKNLDYNNDAELPVNIGIVGADSTELNVLTYDYQDLYNTLFAPADGRYLSRAAMFGQADSLKRISDKRFAAIGNVYFKNYVFYSIASVNASVSRGENFLVKSYITGRPIQYHNNEYMQFFNTCFKGYLNTVAASHKGQTLYNIINAKASYPLLCDFLKEDKLIASDSLRELVILKNLWDFYFNPEFAQESIESIVTQLSMQTRIAEHQAICRNMLAFFKKMEPGSVAPDFSARNRNGKIASLGSFKNKWVYLNFFSTNKTESLKEMPKIAALKKKYGDKVVFISVCVDDSLKAYNDYLKANPKFDWNILFNNTKGLSKTAKDNYNVTGSEAYFLVDNKGYLAMSPALSPSQGIEYRFNIIFKVRQRNTRTGIR